jgi:hypothetical protein
VSALCARAVPFEEGINTMSFIRVQRATGVPCRKGEPLAAAAAADELQEKEGTKKKKKEMRKKGVTFGGKALLFFPC